MSKEKSENRLVSAVYGLRKIPADSLFERQFATYLKEKNSLGTLHELYNRFSNGVNDFDQVMRRIIFGALVRELGDGLNMGLGVDFLHPETFAIGKGVFIGAQVYIQGRYDGTCSIGDGTWIGPQSYFDARDLVIGEKVGWGPGAKVLGSAHTGIPLDMPIIDTDLEIKPVRIGDGVDVGVNAIILPGVTVGDGAIIGAGSVVSKDVEANSVVAGVPARFMRRRDEH